MESAIYIVATPIGNLSDITYRAVEVLGSVSTIAAEDTRHTRKLLDHLGIRGRLLSLHEHNELNRGREIVELVKSGESVALVSDAGTPLISDPGHHLVRLAYEEGVKVIPIPGASAAITALCASGVPGGRFIFEGFLPAKKKAKMDLLTQFSNDGRTIVMYESPHRIIETVDLMVELFPDRELVIARELTKRFETFYRDTVRGVKAFLEQDENQRKGEFVVILSASKDVEAESIGHSEAHRMLDRLNKEMPPKKAATVVADLYGGSKREYYDYLVGKV